MTANTGPWPFVATVKPAALNISECDFVVNEVKKHCADAKPPECSDACKHAQRCVLVQKNQTDKVCCAPDRSGHHLIEVHCFSQIGARGTALDSSFEKYSHACLHAADGLLCSFGMTDILMTEDGKTWRDATPGGTTYKP